MQTAEHFSIYSLAGPRVHARIVAAAVVLQTTNQPSANYDISQPLVPTVKTELTTTPQSGILPNNLSPGTPGHLRPHDPVAPLHECIPTRSARLPETSTPTRKWRRLHFGGDVILDLFFSSRHLPTDGDFKLVWDCLYRAQTSNETSNR